MRALGVGLLLVLSVALTSYAGSFYGLGLGERAYPSLPLRALVLNGIVVGLATWAVSWMTDRRRASTAAPRCRWDRLGRDAGRDHRRPVHAGSPVLVLAAILIPEARLILYDAFARADFSHSRLSIVALLPQAALVTIFAHRLLAAGQRNGRPWTDVRSAAFRWLAAGLELGSSCGWRASCSPPSPSRVLERPWRRRRGACSRPRWCASAWRSC